MPQFILRRFLEAVPLLLLVITFTFFMLRLAPGGPFSEERDVPPAVLASIEAHYGLDLPLHRQYFNYLGGLLRGDLGPSYRYAGRSVNELIAGHLPVSIELGLYSLALALFFGVGAGLIASIKPNSITDHLPMSLAMIGICLPTFVLGPVLILVFGLHLGWTSVGGWDTAADRILPAITLGAFYTAYIARLTRGGMREILAADYIRTARAKGLPERKILFKHILKPGILPTISFLGPAAAGLITGSFVVESIFQIPGLGQLFVNAAFNRDYTLVLGVVILYAAFIVALNFLVDIVLVLLNPKLKFE